MPIIVNSGSNPEYIICDGFEGFDNDEIASIVCVESIDDPGNGTVVWQKFPNSLDGFTLKGNNGNVYDFTVSTCKRKTSTANYGYPYHLDMEYYDLEAAGDISFPSGNWAQINSETGRFYFTRDATREISGFQSGFAINTEIYIGNCNFTLNVKRKSDYTLVTTVSADFHIQIYGYKIYFYSVNTFESVTGYSPDSYYVVFAVSGTHIQRTASSGDITIGVEKTM